MLLSINLIRPMQRLSVVVLTMTRPQLSAVLVGLECPRCSAKTGKFASTLGVPSSDLVPQVEPSLGSTDRAAPSLFSLSRRRGIEVTRRAERGQNCLVLHFRHEGLTLSRVGGMGMRRGFPRCCPL